MDDSTLLLKKNKPFILSALLLVVILLLLYWIGDIILPFILGIFIAFLLQPFIQKIQKRIKNRNLAITVFFAVIVLSFAGIIVFFGGHFIRDSQRFVNAVEIFTIQNEQQIQDIKDKVVGVVNAIYESETVQTQIEDDALMKEAQELDVMSTIKSVYSFFETPNTDENTAKRSAWSPFIMIIYTLIYSVLIMYTYPYYQDKLARYKGSRIPVNNRFLGIFKDFKSVFIDYFRQRSLVVLINSVVFMLTFTILDLPGAIIIAVLAGLLSYASHFHYLSLPMVIIGCSVLSIENDTNFFIYFGIILVVFIIISILDETIYFDKIMNSINGMNPGITVLSFVLWIYLFGSFIGTIIALPLTQLILIYLDKLLLYKPKEK